MKFDHKPIDFPGTTFTHLIRGTTALGSGIAAAHLIWNLSQLIFLSCIQQGNLYTCRKFGTTAVHIWPLTTSSIDYMIVIV